MKAFTKLLFALVVILSLTIAPIYAANIDIQIDGTSIKFNESSGFPYIDENQRTMVPLRVTMEAFGAEVTWNQIEKTAIIQKDSLIVKSIIGQKHVFSGNEKISNDAAAVIKNNRTYLPIRVVLECFGAEVGWDNINKAVLINSQNSSGIVYQIENNTNISKNQWQDYSDGMSLKEGNNYALAKGKLESVVPLFMKDNNPTNMAILFGNIGECYANLKEFDKAAACWVREGYYWSKCAKSQETIAAIRKADYIKSEVQLYLKTQDDQKNKINYFNAPLEPTKGIILGAYAESDPAVHDSSSMQKFYMNEFPKLVDKDHSAYLLYFTYGLDLSIYDSHIQKAIEKDKIIELALQPLNGMDSVNTTDGYLIKLAKDMENSGCNFLLRFANEMNDPTNPWYTTNYNNYIEKFRMVSNTFKEYAPSVAIVWAPNFFPPDTIPNYYPGDDYVDYVGISSYQNYSPNLDPLKQGIDRGRWSSQLDHIYSLYGDRKPIIITEGGSSFKDRITKADISTYAAKQVKDFYTYLPIKYPNVKAVFIYGADTGKTNYTLSQNDTLLNSYSNAIKNEYYLSNYKDASKITSYYYKLNNNTKISPIEKQLNAYLKYAEDYNIGRVEYLINGNLIGSTYDIPYTINCDFSKYSGQNITITVNVYTSSSKLLLTNKIKTYVNP